MMLTILAVLVGYFVGKGRTKSYRLWKMLGIVLGMSFFLSIIVSFLPDVFQQIILPVGTVELIDLIYPQFGMGAINFVLVMLVSALFTMSLTFFWFLVGRFSKWLISKRGL